MGERTGERLRILGLVRDGAITADEALRLLGAMGAHAAEGASAASAAGVPQLDLVFRESASPIRAWVTKFGTRARFLWQR